MKNRNRVLLPHQVSTIEHAARADARGHGTMLFHSMGTGKTTTALGLCLKLFPKRQILVYAPGHLKSVWEIEKKAVNTKNSMDIRVYAIDALSTPPPGKTTHSIVIVDEAHYLLDMVPKNPEIFRYLRSFHRAYFLTGTPFKNNLDEVALYINILAKKTVIPGSMEIFTKMFTIPITRGQRRWNNWCVRTLSMVWGHMFKPVLLGTYRVYGKTPALLMFLSPLITSRLRDLVMFKPITNVHALAQAIQPYMTITSSRGISSGSLTFPTVTRTHQICSYTREQLDKVLSMLSSTDGMVTNANLKNLYGNEVSDNNRNARLSDMIAKLIGNAKHRNAAAGPDFSRVSGWWKTEPPQKFVFVASRCASIRRIVLYTRYKTVASRLVGYLTSEGFGARIQNLNDTYPAVNLASMQAEFLGSKDIVVLHPLMTEGISIRGATMLVVMEPFVDAVSKQQLEARVARLGSHAMVNDNRVEIVTCATGIDLMSDPFEDKSILTVVRESVVALVRGIKRSWKLMKLDTLSHTPPWLIGEDTDHLNFGPEVEHELKIVDLEKTLDAFRREAEVLLKSP